MRRHLKSRAEKFGFRFDNLLGILDTLEGIASQLRTMVEFANRLKELEQAVQNAKFNPPENAVTLSTFHSAKGLEFRRVFMIDLLKGIIPSEEDESDDCNVGRSAKAILRWYDTCERTTRIAVISVKTKGNRKKIQGF